MLQLDPTTQASLEAATTPNARAAAILSSLSGTITVTVRDGTGSTKGSGTMTSFGTLSANVIVLNNVTSFTVSETGTPDPETWTIEFANAGGRFVKGTFGLYTSPVAEFKWSLATWENGQSGTIASAYCTVRKNEVLTDVVDTFNVAATPVNQAPYWLTNSPTTLSQTAGSTFNFSSYATDPDGTPLVFTLVTQPSGYSITSAGVLTIGAASNAIQIRVTDAGGLQATHTCQITVSTQDVRKWYPGIYIKQDTSLLPSKVASMMTFLDRFDAVPVDRAHYLTSIPWGQLERQRGVYTWDLVDTILDRVCGTRTNPNGRKFYLAIWWQKFGSYTTSTQLPSTPQTGDFYLPDYLIQQKLAYYGSSTFKAKMWDPACMGYYIDLLAAVADRYDNDERVAMVATEEGAFEAPLDGSISNTTMNQLLTTQSIRMIDAARALFVRTPWAYLNNFVGGPTTAGNGAITQRLIDTGCAVGAPDTRLGRPQYNYYYVRGYRYNSATATWVAGAAPDQTYSTNCEVEKQTNRDMAWTPDYVYSQTMIEYNPCFFGWVCQELAYLVDHSGDPAYRIPAMDRARIFEWLIAAPRPVRTTKPSVNA